MRSLSLVTTALNQRILENLATAILVLDESLKVLYINPAGEMVFAASARQVLGMPLGELLPEPSLLQRIGQAQTTAHPFTERELHVTLADGHEIIVDLTVTPLLDPQHVCELLLEMVQIDRHVRIAREELLFSQQQATRAVVRGLAHEIKNPLGGLRGAAQLLERELSDPALREYTGIIIGEADRLRNLVNRLLGPHTLPHKCSVNLHEILERVRTVTQAEAPSAIHFMRDYDPSIPELYADADQLIQALLNILRNAVQALDTRGEILLRTRTQRQVTLGQKRHKLVARVDISDNGPGVPPELIERIFYPMVTTRPEGAGLGLSIAQNLINQHNGLIECVSRPGWTTFTVWLPLENEHE